MTKAERITEYIKNCFREYSLDYNAYFTYDFGDGIEEVSLQDENGKVLPTAIEFASEILGISKDDIMKCSKNAMNKWLDKYCYFWYGAAFDVAIKDTYYKDYIEKTRVLQVLFESADFPDDLFGYRYDYSQVIQRLLGQLKETDKIIPGTYHQNAGIENLTITTENFCHFPEIKEMTKSYIEMEKTLERLFFKAIQRDLDEEEINEYNLLVSVFGFRDKCYPRGYLYYNNLKRSKQIYASATYNTLFDYIILKRAFIFEPWRCAEFVEDEQLVRDYLQVFPNAKSMMRYYAMDSANFFCSFVWSDAKPVSYDDMDDGWIADCQEYLNDGENYEEVKEPTVVFVPKTAKELNGDDLIAEKLTTYCRPKKLGGIPVKMRGTDTFPGANELRRLEQLMRLIDDNNFVERLVKKAYFGGDRNE